MLPGSELFFLKFRVEYSIAFQNFGTYWKILWLCTFLLTTRWKNIFKYKSNTGKLSTSVLSWSRDVPVFLLQLDNNWNKKLYAKVWFSQVFHRRIVLSFLKSIFLRTNIKLVANRNSLWFPWQEIFIVRKSLGKEKHENWKGLISFHFLFLICAAYF